MIRINKEHEEMINVGYDIISLKLTNFHINEKNLIIPEDSIVLGYNPNAACQYVTWEYNHINNWYVVGHYYNDFYSAYKDFCERGNIYVHHEFSVR